MMTLGCLRTMALTDHGGPPPGESINLRVGARKGSWVTSIPQQSCHFGFVVLFGRVCGEAKQGRHLGPDLYF